MCCLLSVCETLLNFTLVRSTFKENLQNIYSVPSLGQTKFNDENNKCVVLTHISQQTENYLLELVSKREREIDLLKDTIVIA